jgi:general secretion pathway protein G
MQDELDAALASRGTAAKGFTLIEVLVTLVIVSIIASAALPVAELAVKRTKEHELRVALVQIREALDAYKQAADAGRLDKSTGASGYPPSLRELVIGAHDKTSATRQMVVFLRRIPRDPFYPDPSAPSEATWGKRSYASSPEAPAEGADVFDVYSLSTDVGLNAVPYREW